MGYLTRLIRRSHFWRISGLLAADAVVFGATDPRSTVSFMLIVGFLLMCATLYCALDGLLMFLGLYGVRFRHRRRVLRTSTLVVSAVLALQSMGQLSTRDVLILGPLVVLGYFYTVYSRDTVRRETAGA